MHKQVSLLFSVESRILFKCNTVEKKLETGGKSILLPNITTSDFQFSSSPSLALQPHDTNTIKDDNDGIKLSPPPCYSDKESFYASAINSQLPQMKYNDYDRIKNQRYYSVEKREEEGKEELPPYECTISKMGYMMVKNELDGPDEKSKRRSWRKLYIMLWGTNIRAYKTIPMTELEEKKPIWCYSMQDAEAGQPSDYCKYRHVIRLRLHQGSQLLIRAKDERDQMEWIEHLQASANVSLDLDERKMPHFITSSRRRRRARVHHDSNISSRPHQHEGSLI
ncbi:hypothetical protein BCR42DRAFT_493710 [Absidia repens]|uniref:PH domain-containing protein n=1 Tax=Absidia repens TaxID=90262 RepID=A0A1X2IB60_9FUNG|nr:hypothetical protein BCR42DRAFT_493710 [Absidia repens]